MICPYCRGGVRDGAEKCWHCGAELTGYPQTGGTGGLSAPPPPRPHPQPPVEQPAPAPEQPPQETAPEQPLGEMAPDQPLAEQTPGLSSGSQISDQTPVEPAPGQQAGQEMPDLPLEQPEPQQAAPDQPGEPLITTLPDKEKEQYVVVEGYTDSDALDMDHIKYLLFSSEGRINRRRYWIGYIINMLAGFIVMSICYLISFVLVLLAMLFFAYTGLMLMIKRAHDRDRSGHFIWLMAIPIVSLWPAFEFAFIKGTPGVNRFGPDPL